MQKRENLYVVLDGMRGLAAILVAMFHGPQLLNNLELQYSYLAVDLFFLLSGVVIGSAYEEKILGGLSFGVFAAARLMRLFPLLVVGVALGACVGLARGEVTPLTVWLHVLPSLMFLPNPSDGPLLFPLDGPIWSLFFEMVVNVAFFFGIRHLSESKLHALVCASGVALIGAVLVYHSHNLHKGSTVNTMAVGLLRCVFSFSLGVLFARFYRAAGRPVLAPRGANLATLAVLALATACLMFNWPTSGLWDLACVLLLFPALIFVAIRLRPSGAVKAFCGISGAISYPLYVIHEPIMRYCTGLAAAHDGYLAGLPAPWSGAVLLAALVPVALGLEVLHRLLVRWILDPYLRNRSVAFS